MTRRAVLAVSLLGLTACEVEVPARVTGDIYRNQCERTSDCRAGSCKLGICVAPTGEIETLLLEVLPPSTFQRVGGMRFLEVDSGFSTTSGGYELDLSMPSTVVGFVRAYDVEKQADCLLESGTLPVQVTFTPREQRFGLPASSIVTVASLNDDLRSPSERQNHACRGLLPGNSIYEFTASVPPGEYDVYVEPARTGSLAEDLAETECRIVPKLFSQVRIAGSTACVPLAPGEPRPVAVRMSLPSGGIIQSFEGWRADIVLGTTGRAISTRAEFALEKPTEGAWFYGAELLEYPPLGGNPGASSAELLRLSPPEGQTGPVIQLVLSTLLLNQPGVAEIPSLPPFPAPVTLESWVWRKQVLEDLNREDPAPARVTLTATKLQGLSEGIFASFSTAVDVGEDGRLRATVLPGTYRVRVEPPLLSGLAAIETTIQVPCTPDAADPARCDVSSSPPRVQAGRAILVPDAATITGSVRSPFGRDSLSGAAVIAVPAQLRTRRCGMIDGGADSGIECESRPAGVLDYALGDDQFVPRTVTGTVRRNGGFDLPDADCGACVAGGGAFFDVIVKPQDGSRLPWLIRRGVQVAQDVVDLGQLDLPLPVARRGTVRLAQPGADPILVPDALIRAYVLIDNQGEFVTDTAGLPPCAENPATTERCLRTSLLVAETRSLDDASFTLLLPERID